MKFSRDKFFEKLYEIKDIEVIENTVLFIESYNNSTFGNCKAILKKILHDERFLEWEFIWTLSDLNDGNFNFENDKRIKYVYKDSCEFIEMCAKSKVLIVSDILPQYYIKKSDQLLIACFSTDLFYMINKNIMTKMLLQMTLDKLNILYVEDNFIMNELKKFYKNKIPFKVIIGQPFRFLIESTLNSNVIVSLSEDLIGEKSSDLEVKWRDCNFLISLFQIDICFYISQKLYNSIATEVFADLPSIVSGEMCFSEVSGNADIVITDRANEAFESIQRGIICIFISKNRMLPGYFEDYNLDLLIFADNWDDAINLLKIKIEDGTQCYKSNIFNNVEYSLNSLLEIMINQSEYSKFSSIMTTYDELWIISEKISKGFCEIMKYYKLDKNIFIVICGEEQQYERYNEFCDNKRIYLIGDFNNVIKDSNKVELYSFFRNCIFGNQYFENIYIHNEINRSYLEFFKYSFSKLFVLYNKKEMIDIFFKGFINKQKKKLKCVELNENKYYILGRQDGNTYYLEKKRDIINTTIIFINSLLCKEEYENFISESNVENVSYIFIDPYRLMKDSKIIKNSNVYWIPIDIIPIRLLKNAKNIYVYDENIIFKENLKIVL